MKQFCSYADLVHSRYIASLDGEYDAKVLGEELKGAISSGSLLTLRIGTMMLKKCAQAGLSVFDIGRLVFTQNPEESTFMERVANEAYSIGLSRQARRNDCNSPEMENVPIHFPTDIYSITSIEEDFTLLPETELFILK